MTALERIREFLAENASQNYCDDCLSYVLDIRPRQQVQQNTSALAKTHPFYRISGPCARCHSEKRVIGSRASKPVDKKEQILQPISLSASVAIDKTTTTPAEERLCGSIRGKDRALRAFLDANELSKQFFPTQWLSYLVGIKSALGNLNNDVSFIATVLIKHYLMRRFAVTTFDAGAKAQGARGIDIEARTADGKTIIGELKTTKPYQPNFGAAQRTNILKDLSRLAKSKADYRLMFVIDPDAFRALSHSSFASYAPDVEVVDLVS